ncbi:hypothetical protein [Streptomyces sp. GS7]|uniref:hypothetical protein n=1 Tax=Streptomyces sp. GS7 TaxID=2692234 RepID=UPI0013187B88|nr:hypothetical protein [Streptomyces sp. GS7]QHC25046.1 hypothetical protein GR130_30470 [Streptomyces sp. GS7]
MPFNSMPCTAGSSANWPLAPRCSPAPIRTLHPLLATICTPASLLVSATVRMRRGKAADSRGAPKLVSETLATAVEAGCTGIRILRADSQFYNAGVIAACRRGK